MNHRLEPLCRGLRYVLVASCATAALAAATSTAPDTVSVRVNYTGQGTVDANHDLQVFLFDDPNIGRQSVALDLLHLRENGGTVRFRGVKTDPVFVAVAYNATGNYDGSQGPPPEGTPIAIYRVADASSAAPVHPGASIEIVFDGSTRMGP